MTIAHRATLFTVWRRSWKSTALVIESTRWIQEMWWLWSPAVWFVLYSPFLPYLSFSLSILHTFFNSLYPPYCTIQYYCIVCTRVRCEGVSRRRREHQRPERERLHACIRNSRQSWWPLGQPASVCDGRAALVQTCELLRHDDKCRWDQGEATCVQKGYALRSNRIIITIISVF